MRRPTRRLVTAALALLTGPGPAPALDSAIDVPMRIIAEALSRVWGQQAVVINQPGAGGAIAARAAASAAPDGYTLGMVAFSAFVAAPVAADNLPIHLPKDCQP